jgi:hypothetical protein
MALNQSWISNPIMITLKREGKPGIARRPDLSLSKKDYLKFMRRLFFHNPTINTISISIQLFS